MASPRSILVASLPTDTPNGVIEVTIRWHDDRRFYYLSLAPITKTVRNGMEVIQFALLSGKSLRLETATRFSYKRLQELATSSLDLPAYREALETVLQANKLKLI